MNFDLKELLQSAVAGYRDAFPGARIELETPPDACFMRGAPDLIVQMLDKLIENAVDFCPAKGTITVRLARAGSRYELAVINDGPPIPAPCSSGCSSRCSSTARARTTSRTSVWGCTSCGSSPNFTAAMRSRPTAPTAAARYSR